MGSHFSRFYKHALKALFLILWFQETNIVCNWSSTMYKTKKSYFQAPKTKSNTNLEGGQQVSNLANFDLFFLFIDVVLGLWFYYVPNHLYTHFFSTYRLFFSFITFLCSGLLITYSMHLHKRFWKKLPISLFKTLMIFGSLSFASMQIILIRWYCRMSRWGQEKSMCCRIFQRAPSQSVPAAPILRNRLQLKYSENWFCFS